MRKTKKFLAIVAAMAMALAPTSVFAAPAASTGEGASSVELEGAVKTDYLDYVAPTVGDNTFDFLLDPQELISSTDGQTLGGDAVVTEAGVTVYFKKGSGYAASSEALEVTNKGTTEITVSVNATMALDATGSSINVVTDAGAVSTGSGLNLRIHLDQVTGGAVTASGGGATAALAPDSEVPTKSALSLEATAAAADLDDFEVTKAAVSGGGMEYQYLPKSDDASGGSVAFVFYGECNQSDDADWTAVKGMSATFDVVWNISSANDVAKVSKTQTDLTWTDRTKALTFKVDLASMSATKITDVGLVYDGKAFACNNAWTAGTAIKDYVTMQGDTIVMDSFLKDFFAAAGTETTVYIQFDNSDAKMLTIKVK